MIIVIWILGNKMSDHIVHCGDQIYNFCIHGYSAARCPIHFKKIMCWYLFLHIIGLTIIMNNFLLKRRMCPYVCVHLSSAKWRKMNLLWLIIDWGNGTKKIVLPNWFHLVTACRIFFCSVVAQQKSIRHVVP